ncbi:MAG TPA: YsnF/AvaK domain-containing protein [Allosphingosinicella sp.]|nr:YsnF/AvaK domain-containing protein [Allosphingosinicella sp.]
MSQIVTALYDSREEAARALHALRAEVSLTHAGIYDRSDARLQALRHVDLTPEERSACEDKLATGDYLLLARPRSGEGPDDIISVLERVAAEPPRETRSSAPSQGTGTVGSSPSSPSVVAEERIPLVEEELQIGTREVVRGGARVRTRVEEVPVAQEIELMSELVRVSSRPASRPVGEQELEQGGLLRDRVIEIAQVREEAVVIKEVVVREEIVVTKTTERRVEHIHETVRRTVVETEDLGNAAAGGRGQP